VAASLCLALLLALQHAETRRWQRHSASFEQLHLREQAAHLGTEVNHRRAVEAARTADRANLERARAEQATINQRTSDDLQNRLRAARARAEQLRIPARPATAAGPGRGRAAPVPAVSAASGQSDEAPGQAGLPLADRLIATEQAIQLEELIKWVEQQSTVDPNR
jgi:hypothetical protein